MTGSTAHITEIVNPASVGWSYSDGETEVQVAWPRGTRTLILALRTVPDGPWRHAGPLDKGRWSIQPTLESARARAQEFLALEEARRQEVQP